VKIHRLVCRRTIVVRQSEFDREKVRYSWSLTTRHGILRATTDCSQIYHGVVQAALHPLGITPSSTHKGGSPSERLARATIPCRELVQEGRNCSNAARGFVISRMRPAKMLGWVIFPHGDPIENLRKARSGCQDQFPVFGMVLKKRGRTWRWGVCTTDGAVVTTIDSSYWRAENENRASP
jgi:hypothetical protein